MFEEGSTAKAVIDILANALNFMLHRRDIIDQSNLTKDAVRSVLYRLHKRKLVQNSKDDPNNIERGYWKLVRLYRKLRHTKRVIETHQNKKNPWVDHVDAEATSEGYVPYYPALEATSFRYNKEFPIPPDIPEDMMTSQYGRIVNPKLKTEFLRILADGDHHIFLIEELTEIEPTCHPRHFPTPQFCIEGTEWLDDISGTFNPVHKVEVVFQNLNYGTIYHWEGSFQVSEDEFN